MRTLAWSGSLCLALGACHPKDAPAQVAQSAVVVAPIAPTPVAPPADDTANGKRGVLGVMKSVEGAHLASIFGKHAAPRIEVYEATVMGLGNLGGIGHGYGGGGGRGGMRANDGRAVTESYAHHADLGFRDPRSAPLSTFSADVDTAAYANVRRFLLGGEHPPADAVRIEELVNYPRYHDAPPTDAAPLVAHVAVGSCPWAPTHRLLRIAVKAREIDVSRRPPSNLVLLIDTSGSMEDENKLPLLVRSLELLVEKLDARDRVSIVTYAGSSGVALPPTRGDEHATITAALRRLRSGGSTNGGAGLMLAYDLATRSKVQGINRVVLATDGDWNVGVTSEGGLVRAIEREAKRGIALSVLGFGMGNYKDSTMEQLADHGDGNYAYIDTLAEGHRVLVEQMTGTLMTVAKDVKLQLELNPAQVTAYRQLGYEDRQLRDEQFNDDKVDAGDVGAGHDVVALYELVPRGVAIELPRTDPLKYASAAVGTSSELATVKIRWKAPGGGASQLASTIVTNDDRDAASPDFTLSAGIAELGMLLRSTKERGAASFDQAMSLVRAGGDDPQRAELVRMVDAARGSKLTRR